MNAAATTALDRANVIEHFGIPGRADQDRHTCAVIMPTILRSSLRRAVHTIYDQDLDGTIRIMIGIDGGWERRDDLQALIDERPENVSVDGP